MRSKFAKRLAQFSHRYAPGSDPQLPALRQHRSPLLRRSALRVIQKKRFRCIACALQKAQECTALDSTTHQQEYAAASRKSWQQMLYLVYHAAVFSLPIENSLTLILDVHPQTPQARLLRQAAEQARAGGLLVYPTDTCYALGCCMSAKAAQERLRQIRQLDVHHDLSLLFSSISQLTEYAKLDDRNFAILKRVLPGPFTFILPATHDVPRRLADPRRRSIGVRVPDAPVVQGLLGELGEPLMSSTLQLPGDSLPLHEVHEITDRIGNRVDVLLRAEDGKTQCSTVIDLSEWPPRLLRRGLGDPDSLGIELADTGNPIAEEV